MEILSSTLGQIVADNFKAATVFQKHNLDFCCKGNRNFVDACNDSGLNPAQLAAEIGNLQSTPVETDFRQWPLDMLIDHIYRQHHQYVEQVTPSISQLLDKVAKVHRQGHPELAEIREIFNVTSGHLAVHMKKEELLLFPLIRKLERIKADRGLGEGRRLGSVRDMIENMEDDHLDEGQQLFRMAELSGNYTIPLDACASFSVLYQMLKEYETDIHVHIHLENNILFPRAIALEQELKVNNG